MKKQNSILSNKIIFSLCVIIFFFILISTLPLPWNTSLKNSIIDLQFKIRGSRQLSENIIVVFIGAEDVQALGGWQISRDYYWYVTYILDVLGAKVIGIDLLFDQANRNYPEYDAALADIFSSTKKVCLPMAFSELTKKTKASNKFSKDFMEGENPTLPLKQFSDQAAGLGFSNFGKQAVVRKVPLSAVYGDSVSLSFSFELARIYLNGSRQVKISHQKISFTDSLGKLFSFPIDGTGQMRLNHFGDINNLKTISFVDLLQSFEPARDSLDFKDKLVIIAVTAPGIANLKATPLSNALPASLIHATVAENLIRQNYLQELPIFVNYLVIVLLVIFTWIVWQSKKTILIIAGNVTVICGYWIFSMVLFGLANLILPLFYPTLVFFAALSIMAIMRSVQRREKEDSLKQLLKQQVTTKQKQLNEAKDKLSELQKLLKQETTVSEKTQQLARQQSEEILKFEKELSDLQTYVLPEKQALKLQVADIVYSENSKMANVLELAAKVGKDDISVLITGETGTGKEIVARAIHQTSNRKDAPFVVVNCGALPETLLESELFGHEKGSFTGAQSRRRGRFELANGGIIFLDEITETTPKFQTRLLRVLQEGTFERLGGEQTLKVDVRVIAATNKNLQEEIKKNRFRSDLFYRLNGFPIHLPSLRERGEDIPFLAAHFLRKYKYDPVSSFSDRVMEIFHNYNWQGNVRELENVVRRAALLAQSEGRKIIRESDLPEEILQQEIKVDFKPLVEQILEMLRSLKFSHSAISQTAKVLGNRDRGTITEHFRGICFEQLVESDFDVEKAANIIAGTDEKCIVEKVKNKIEGYLNNVRNSFDSFEKEGTGSLVFKGLPKKYYVYLEQVIEFMKD